MLINCLKPIIEKNTKILILGTSPSNESVKEQKYYANPQNQFWDIIYRILESDWDCFKLVDKSVTHPERYNLLFENRIGLWDVLESCERNGSSDSKIKNPIVNDFAKFTKEYNEIEYVLFNGGKGAKYFYEKYNGECIKDKFESMTFFKMNSTSSQNPNNTFNTLYEWKSVLNKILQS